MHVSVGAQNPEEGIGSPCAGVSVAVRPLTLVLGSELRSSARPAHILNHCAISPVLGLRV